MKFLILLALIGFTQAIPVSLADIDFNDIPDLDWESSLWNWFEEETDIRGPHMKCIEKKLTLTIVEKEEEGEAALEWAKEWYSEMENKTSDEKLADFKETIKVFQKHAHNFLGIYDTAVASCRNDDKFSLVHFVDKFFDLFYGLDDSAMKEFLSEIYEEDEEDTTAKSEDKKSKDSDESDEDDEESICYKNSVPKLKECVKNYFSFATYEEKGVCGSDYKKMIECLEQTGQKCTKEYKSEIKIAGSVLFRFMYDSCHHH